MIKSDILINSANKFLKQIVINIVSFTYVYCIYSCLIFFCLSGRIGEVMISMAASIAVDRRLYSRSGQSNVYETGIREFSAKHAALRSNSPLVFSMR